MDVKAIKNSPIGTLVPITGVDGRTNERYSHFAYLADPLPESLPLESKTWTVVASAEASLARLNEAARQVPNPSLLRRPALRREAHATSALEGTYAPFQQVLQSEPDDRGQLSLDLREIMNYVVAAEEGFSWIFERPFTVGLIENLQGILVQDTPSEYGDAGRVRDRNVFIGSPDAPIEESRFVPAPGGDQLIAGVEAWVKWVNNPVELPPVVLAGAAHYQFETLHPFSDGNGRIGRLLIVLQLMRLGALQHPILVVSPWFEARRAEYQDKLLGLSVDGDWDSWIGFFAEGVRAAADTTHDRVVRLIEWQAETLETLRGARVTGFAERLARDLIGSPVLRASDVANKYGVTHQAAMNGLRRLTKLGILDESAFGNRVIFTVPGVVRIISE